MPRRKRKINKPSELQSSSKFIGFQKDILNNKAQRIFTKLFPKEDMLRLRCFSMFSLSAPFREKAFLLMTIGKYFGLPKKRLEKLALVSELIMAGALTADDIIDRSALRRGKKSGLAKYGAEKSYFIAECLYASAFELLIDNSKLLSKFIDAYKNIQIGQYLTLEYSRNQKYITSNTLDSLAYLKAGSLFEATTSVPAALSRNKHLIEFKKFGRQVGIALQHRNDISDFSWTKKNLGRIGYEDLINGQPNLVLVYLIKSKKIDSKDKKIVLDIWERASNKMTNQEIIRVTKIIEKSEAIASAKKHLDKHCQLAENQLSKMPKSKYLNHLFDFINLLREV